MALLANGACSAKKNTQLMIAVQTDMSTPKDLDAIRIQVSSLGVVHWRQDYLNIGGQGIKLPASIALTPADREPRPIDIEIFGVKGAAVRVLRRARTTFAKDRVALLRMPLRFSCYRKLDCGEGQSCVAGECKDAAVAVEALPDFVSEEQVTGKPTNGTSTEADGCWDPLACLSPSVPVAAAAGEPCVFDLATVPNVLGGLTVVLATQNGQLGFCDSGGTCRVPLDNDPEEGWDFTDATRTKIRIAKGICAGIGAETSVAVTTQCGTKTILRPFCDTSNSVPPDTGTPVVDSSVPETTPPDTDIPDSGADIAPVLDTSMPDTFVADTAVMDTADVGAPVTAHDPGPSMSIARARHSVGVLTDGRVIVAGGYEVSTAIATKKTELFDPTTNTWASTVDLGTARYGAASAPAGTGEFVVVGGRNEMGSLATGEVFAVGTSTWAPIPAIPDGIRSGGHTLTNVGGGSLLLVGGQGASFLASAHRLSITTKTWAATPSMGVGRAFHSATLLNNGKVLVAGGESDTGVVSSAELYDVGTATWAAAPSLSVTRSRHQATLLADGRVLVTGGGVNTAEIYNPTSNTWSLSGTLSAGRGNHIAGLLPDGRVFVAGGEPGGIATTELWNPATGAWTAGTAMFSGRADAGAVVFARSSGSFTSSVFIVGGKTAGASLSTTEFFNF